MKQKCRSHSGVRFTTISPGVATRPYASQAGGCAMAPTMTARIFPARGLRETAFARLRPFHQLARLATEQNWSI
jgi:hypothetical protein